MANGVIALPDLKYTVPGAQISLSGTYSLDGALHFDGTARMHATVSQMVGGWKGFLLKPADRFFKKNGAGTLVPIRCEGRATIRNLAWRWEEAAPILRSREASRRIAARGPWFLAQAARNVIVFSPEHRCRIHEQRKHAGCPGRRTLPPRSVGEETAMHWTKSMAAAVLCLLVGMGSLAVKGQAAPATASQANSTNNAVKNPATGKLADWWKNGVFYEIYPRSFQDSNGDGIGDLNGITQRLDYLKRIGVDAIWLTPIYPSPQVDFGYDISDYEAIDPQYGTMADFDRLVAEARKHNIRVIMDMVMNHSSDKHKWFLESRSSRNNPYRDWYVWKDGKGETATSPGEPPNNWVSDFGGSAWTWTRKRGSTTTTSSTRSSLT